MNPPPPPRPPPPPPPRPVAYQEPYGAVQMTQRRTVAAASSEPPAASSYYGHQGDATSYAQTPYMSTASPNMYSSYTTTASPSQLSYSATAQAPSPPSSPPSVPSKASSNVSLAFLITPLLAMLYTENGSKLLLPVLLCTALVLYSLDLANLRNASCTANWVALVVLSVSNVYDTFRSNDNTSGFFYPALEVVVESLFLACWALWLTLQYQWIASGTRRITESLLSNFLPLTFACVLTNSVMMRVAQHVGKDTAATVSPYLFCLCLAAGMFCTGKPSRWNSLVLQVVPPLLHVASFRRRIWKFQYGWSELVLVCSVPYLINFGLTHYKSGKFEITTLRGTLVPMVVSVVASLSLQSAYLIPWCQSIAYLFYGHNVPPTWVFVVYLTLATLAALFAIWVSGKKSAQTNEPLFGEFHEDVVQVSLAFTGLCFGRAIGIPWNLTPLPILAFLGLSVWMTTRMLRYLAIFLFVLHSTGIVLFSYRFAGISSTINLSIPGIHLGLIRFGMIVVMSSVLIGLIMGLAVRSPGGYGTALLKKTDVTGLLLVVYGVFLTVLECTLLKEPVPFRSLTGAEVTEWDNEDSTLYASWTFMLTSVILGCVTHAMQRYKLITPRSAVISYSISIGKVIAVFIDMSGREDVDNNRTSASLLLLRSLVASLMLVVMLAPRVVLEPVHVKTTTGGRYKRSLGPSGKPSDVSNKSDQVIFVYTIVLLPLTLAASVTIVLKPLAMAISGHYGGAYYVSPPGPTEVLGFAMSLWGLSCLSMVNHYLPDGGGEMWKKVSALTFLMGVGVTLSAPTVPAWMGGGGSSTRASLASNPYATISRVGANLVTDDRSRAGGWGLLSASLATLLAVTGPLELQERRDASGKKDSLLLFRMMVFSLMFGCGVAWFITMQCMSEEEFLSVFVTATACMAMAFFGTVAGVLGYFLELDNFDEAAQVAKVWLGAFPIFGLIAGVSQFAGETSHPFRMGGWLSTYLALCGAVLLGFALVLRSRHIKNSASRGLGNLSCIAAWLCSVVVLFGRFGVSGLDGGLDKTSFVGIPISVFGTFVTSLILLALDGEVSGPRRSKIQFMGGSANQSALSFGINLEKLGPSNRFAPSVAACLVVLLCASTYAIFIRGCGLLSVATSHEQVFAKVFGHGGKTTGGLDLTSVLKKSAVHDKIITSSAKLAGSGFWTADNIFGPLLHLGGLVATLPSLYFLVTGMWSGERSRKAALAAPLNLIPIILCRGISALRACAVIGLVGGVLQVITRRRNDRSSKMQI